MISRPRLADVKKLLTYRPEIALTKVHVPYVYLFCGEPPKIFFDDTATDYSTLPSTSRAGHGSLGRFII